MSRLFAYNYDFEFELAGAQVQPARHRLPWHLLNRQALLLWPLLEPGDFLAVYEEPDPALVAPLAERLGFVPKWWVIPAQETNRVGQDLQGMDLGGLELVPWGWSPSMERLAGKDTGLLPARFNSKLFSHALRPKELAPRAAVVDDPQWLPRFLAQAQQEWGRLLVKHPWGASGKWQLALDGPPTAKVLATARAWVREAGGVLVEERLPLEGEWSLQFEVEANGPKLLGITRLFCDPMGSHRANQVGLQPQVPLKPVLQAAEAMAGVLAQEGYLGPLGVDLLESRGGLKIGELNARLTMGRLCLEWARALGEPGRMEIGPPGTMGPGLRLNFAYSDKLGRGWETVYQTNPTPSTGATPLG
ncbi:MAG: hypothetical protein A2600_14015 [Candidatus Lambdaproteobacteria bacterium RIFOXYD1_FULL_56_27]|uniref:ATP-grasp domain-containing protein n=1 Tax=Candidatus Lambdaproteobacteria bacterium RIFOXYD2_FULL_56_26 TaxID=1817773 RepID=A0A1F6GNU8_9PROT|nr:MAG: hypothetical protein A2557_06240 [Candidatus Lambdaproteobacteria bacterium RIFOXYD2_FULL_56_26]OGG99905.1 MAG: hypothetical protein A2426_09975 [Candidatus Lambdaproteobacteria bacterium RIFOXYC1_FULL_56_13]OGH06304.1 MAG: hypothetical protein A2600_14015 [Candidatus Lambdaproteobacteria bacterium RIFOXYD1_FULL_56_27]